MRTHSTSNQVSRSRPRKSGASSKDSRATSHEPAQSDAKPPVRTFRILIVDDNLAIHEDFRKTLCPGKAGDTAFLTANTNLFGEDPTALRLPPVKFELDKATQGKEALEMVRKAMAAGRPYAMAF